MKKTILIISLLSIFCAFTIVPVVMADPDIYSFEQETYLFQKTAVTDSPWLIILPNSAADTAFGKLEYFNYAVEDGFSFDFKGYDFGEAGGGDENMLAKSEYALIYYVDDQWPADVYVLGISLGKYEPTSRGEAKVLVDVDIKIDGICPIAPIPDVNDVNYPNGGKIWLVPVGILDNPAPCEWTTMTGWPSGGAEILFETSLITYGFVAVPD